MQMTPVAIIIFTVVVAAIIAAGEVYLKGSHDGTLLLTLTFWVALIQGPVAVVAAAEASQGKWVQPLKKELLAFYPLILFIAVLWLAMCSQMDIYQWTEHPGRWLNRGFFILRNFVLLTISFLLAFIFARASLKDSPRKGLYAILYLFSFIITQSLVAFDWVMSLEFPWMSTMFGPIFFMESFYSGLALGGILAAILLYKQVEKDPKLSKVMRDMAIFMFGFSLAWAGLYYGQFLVIWYGNIPWETSFFAVRMDHSPFHEMLYLTIIMLFIVPFVGLLPKSVKGSGVWVTVISVVVLAGLLIERILYILPVTSINFVWFFIESGLIGLLMVIFFVNREHFLVSSKSQ